MWLLLNIMQLSVADHIIVSKNYNYTDCSPASPSHEHDPDHRSLFSLLWFIFPKKKMLLEDALEIKTYLNVYVRNTAKCYTLAPPWLCWY